MSSLAQHLTDLTSRAFEAEGLPPEYGLVRVSDRPDLAQFQCNGAMPAAKIAKTSPREIAQKIVDHLVAHDDIAGCDIAGPGFININVKDSLISKTLAGNADTDHGIARPGGERTVILDYGGPNVAKPMHVGHLRSSIIGESLKRIYNAAGYNTIGDVHLGDWGTQMGQILSELEIRHPDWPYFDQSYRGDYPQESPVTIEDLEKLYPEAAAACKADETRAEQARQATYELQQGRPGYRALWQHFVNVSIAAMKENFNKLDVYFDLWQGESSVHDLIEPMVQKVTDQGLAQKSEGALVMAVAQKDDDKDIPPLILYKKDGAVMYGTTDLATIHERMQTYSPAEIVYIVDQRQALHFEQVFRAARKSGIAPKDTRLIHAGFGTMNGPDGKPFKTRAGGVMKLEDLIGMAVEKATTRLDEADLAQDMSAQERMNIAHKVAIAAIKFADLQNQRQSDYVFDLDRFMSFEGKTGPYLLYQIVRIKSLLRKAEDKGMAPSPGIIIEDKNRDLALLLCALPDAFEQALHNLAPHILCDHAYKLAQEFSRFYAECHILSEDNAELRDSRLYLCRLVEDQLGLILHLLGIQTVERM